jgi:excisionase family DNA binding protein
MKASVELTPEFVEAVAQRVAEILAEKQTSTAEWVTVDVVAQHLGLSRVRVYELAKDGMPHRRVGQRTLRFQSEAVDEWIKQ